MRTPPEPYIGGRSGPSWLEGWAYIIARESSTAPKVSSIICESGVLPFAARPASREGRLMPLGVLTKSAEQKGTRICGGQVHAGGT